jgi:hypothetical protein
MQVSGAASQASCAVPVLAVLADGITTGDLVVEGGDVELTVAWLGGADRRASRRSGCRGPRSCRGTSCAKNPSMKRSLVFAVAVLVGMFIGTAWKVQAATTSAPAPAPASAVAAPSDASPDIGFWAQWAEAASH